MLKEHIPIHKVVRFTKLLAEIPAQRKITNDQYSVLRDELDVDCQIMGRGFKSIKRGKLYSFFIFENLLVLLPCSTNWELENQETFELDILKDYTLAEGNLYGSALRLVKIAAFVRIWIKLADSGDRSLEFKIHIILTSSRLKERIFRSFKSILDPLIVKTDHVLKLKKHSNIDEMQFPDVEDFIENKIEKRAALAEVSTNFENVGSILLWDIENIRLKSSSSVQKDQDVKNIQKIVKAYSPLKSGICVYAEPLQTVNRKKIEMISPLIEAVQVVQAKDAADVELIERARGLIEEHLPQHVIILSGDHLFSTLDDLFIQNSIIPVIVSKGKPSQVWDSVEYPIIRVNLNKPQETFSCPASNCSRKLETKQGLQAHHKAKHENKKKVLCTNQQCTSRFRKHVDMKRHFKAKHD